MAMAAAAGVSGASSASSAEAAPKSTLEAATAQAQANFETVWA